MEFPYAAEQNKPNLPNFGGVTDTLTPPAPDAPSSSTP